LQFIYFLFVTIYFLKFHTIEMTNLYLQVQTKWNKLFYFNFKIQNISSSIKMEN